MNRIDEDSFLKSLIILRERFKSKQSVIIDSSEKVCDIIEANSSCEVEFSVKSDLLTLLGKNEIKVRATYE